MDKRGNRELGQYEVSLSEPACFEDWVYKHYVYQEERVNQLKRKTKKIKLFKSDFINDLYYIQYLIDTDDRQKEN